MIQLKRILILIPCRNEAKGVGKVIRGIDKRTLGKMGYKISILVIDNNSTDNTGKIARNYGAKVVFAPKRGKGNAIKAGIKFVSKKDDYIVFIDGDNTYKTSEIMRLIEPLESGFADMIVGSRLSGKIMKGSISLEHRIANWFYTFLVRHFYRVNTTDVLSGFIAIKRGVLKNISPYIVSEGFEIEMELNIKASKLGYTIFSVPITYDIREGESKIESFKDAFIILYTFFRYLFWNPNK